MGSLNRSKNTQHFKQYHRTDNNLINIIAKSKTYSRTRFRAVLLHVPAWRSDIFVTSRGCSVECYKNLSKNPPYDENRTVAWARVQIVLRPRPPYDGFLTPAWVWHQIVRWSRFLDEKKQRIQYLYKNEPHRTICCQTHAGVKKPSYGGRGRRTICTLAHAAVRFSSYGGFLLRFL